MAYVPWTQELEKPKIHFPFESGALFHFRKFCFSFRVIAPDIYASKCSLTFLIFFIYFVFFQKDLASSKVIEPHSFIKREVWSFFVPVFSCVLHGG